MNLFVAMRLELPGGRVIPPGVHRVGETVTEDEAALVLERPRWGREIRDAEVPGLGGYVVDLRAAPGNRELGVPERPPPRGVEQPGPAPVPGNTIVPPSGVVSLDATNEELAQHLSALSGAEREAYWDAHAVEALNAHLQARFGVEPKNREHGTAAGMIEKRIGL